MTIKVEVNNKVYKFNGKTVAEALGKFRLHWNEIKTKGVITLIDGKKSYKHPYPLPLLRRFLMNSLYRELEGKKLEGFLKSGRKQSPELI